MPTTAMGPPRPPLCLSRERGEQARKSRDPSWSHWRRHDGLSSPRPQKTSGGVPAPPRPEVHPGRRWSPAASCSPMGAAWEGTAGRGADPLAACWGWEGPQEPPVGSLWAGRGN